MENLSSRQNGYIVHLRRIASDGEYRRICGEYLCEGIKTLREAVSFGAHVTSVLWKTVPDTVLLPNTAKQYCVPEELFNYASPMKNSPGPLFTVEIPCEETDKAIKNAIVLDTVQDPGNVGTVIRTASAFGIDAVILTGRCADLYGFKTVRACMGAVFRQRVIRADYLTLKSILEENDLKLYGAALSEKAADVRNINIRGAAVAVGSEGNGLSTELLQMCDGEIIIPMSPDSESLNAAVAASLLMWEMTR